jgi:hypothetical protein
MEHPNLKKYYTILYVQLVSCLYGKSFLATTQ